MAKRILTVSNNPSLLSGRNDLLAMAGYAVASPRSAQDVPAMLASGDFVAVVIGHTVSPQERAKMIPAIRAASRVPIIFVAPAAEPPEPAADFCVNLEQNPGALLKLLEDCTPSD